MSLHTKIEDAILTLLTERGHGKTICPSEASRAVFGSQEGLSKEAMSQTREVAQRLVAQQRIEVLQKGKVVDAQNARGPIRLRLKT